MATGGGARTAGDSVGAAHTLTVEEDRMTDFWWAFGAGLAFGLVCYAGFVRRAFGGGRR